MPSRLSRIIIAPALIALASATGSAATAYSADRYVDLIGVNTHWTYPGVYNGDTIRRKLGESGIRHIRDGSGDLNTIKYLYNTYGIRTTMIIGRFPNGLNEPADASLIDDELNDIKNAGALPAVYAFEGPNETDNNQGIKGDSPEADKVAFRTFLRNFTKTLHDVARADRAFDGVKLVGPSLVDSGMYPYVGDLSAWISHPCAHPYLGSRHPETTGWGDNGYGSIEWTVNYLNKPQHPTGAAFQTECGFHTVWSRTYGHLGVPEWTDSRYTPRMFAIYLQNNVAHAFKYELADQGTDPNEIEENFGFLRRDHSEKPSFVAVKNLIALLKDPGASFTPGSLTPSFSGDTANLDHLLLQKRDGRFYLMLWQGTPCWSPDARTAITVPTRSITVGLPSAITGAKSHRLADDGSMSSSTLTINGGSISGLQITDRIVVLELSGSGTPTNVPPVCSVAVNPASSTVGTSITLTATASDSDGSVVKVEFFNGTTKLGEDTSSAGGWNFTWSGAAVGTHSIKAKATDEDGAATTSAAATVTVKATTAPVGNGNGLLGTYFDNADLIGAAATRTDEKVDFDWGSNSPLSGISADTFSARWQGKVQAQFTELYTFATLSDDGVRLWVNGTKLVDNWTNHASTENTGTIALTAGQKYDIRMEYFDDTLGAVAKMSWSSPSTAKQIIPTSQLSSEADIPSPWVSRDIGGVATSGSAAFASGRWTVTGSGADIWNSTDEFQSVHQPITGDCDLIAKVVSQTVTNPWAKAGVMLRDGHGSGAKHAMMVVTGSNGSAFQRRGTANGASSHTAGSKVAAPYWMKLTRRGSTLRGYESSDGVTWILVGTATIDLPATAEACLVVNSHVDGILSTVVFEQVAFTSVGNG